MTDPPKILIVGYTQAGKSTAARLLAEHYGCNCMSTSQAIGFHLDGLVGGASRVLYSLRLDESEIGDLARGFLFGVGNYLRRDNRAYLVEFCLESESDIVEGVRTVEEYEACKHLFDHIIWIARPGVERGATDELWESFAMKMVINDGTTSELLRKLVAAIQEN